MLADLIIDVEHCKVCDDSTNTLGADYCQVALLDFRLPILIDVGLHNHDMCFLVVGYEVLQRLAMFLMRQTRITNHCTPHTLHHLAWNHKVRNVTILTAPKCLIC